MNSITRKRAAWQPLALAVIGAALLTITGTGVFATLQASAMNVEPARVDSGVLSLTLADNGAGFSEAITNLAPGDTVNRYVTLDNDGSLDGRALTFAAAATGTASLIADGDATRAITIEIASCTVAWDPSDGSCAGSIETLMGARTLADASAPATLVAGDILAGTDRHLRVSLNLPDQDETTINGVLPADTVQGGAVDLTHTFTIAQRDAISD